MVCFKKKSLISITDEHLLELMPELKGSQHKAHQLIQESQGQLGCEVFV